MWIVPCLFGVPLLRTKNALETPPFHSRLFLFDPVTDITLSRIPLMFVAHSSLYYTIQTSPEDLFNNLLSFCHLSEHWKLEWVNLLPLQVNLNMRFTVYDVPKSCIDEIITNILEHIPFVLYSHSYFRLWSKPC